MKLSKLMQIVAFYPTLSSIEALLYECNRECLVHTVINYHSKDEGFLIFNAEAEVAENLTNFGN